MAREVPGDQRARRVVVGDAEEAETGQGRREETYGREWNGDECESRAKRQASALDQDYWFAGAAGAVSAGGGFAGAAGAAGAAA